MKPAIGALSCGAMLSGILVAVNACFVYVINATPETMPEVKNGWTFEPGNFLTVLPYSVSFCLIVFFVLGPLLWLLVRRWPSAQVSLGSALAGALAFGIGLLLQPNLQWPYHGITALCFALGAFAAVRVYQRSL